MVEHWWGDSNFIYLVLMVIFAGMSWAMLRRNRWFYIVLVSFMLTVVAYYWFFFRLFQIRYIYYALPLFCVVFAYGLIATINVQRLCTRFPLRPIVMVTSLVLGYFIFNPIYFTETLETYDPKYNRFFFIYQIGTFQKGQCGGF
ncbi:MAG: hypothetical protein IPL35_15265 [Sphingobacteriales bacterium]|nr:hypothetical protein [Sphingobacteriales bacterium]